MKTGLLFILLSISLLAACIESNPPLLSREERILHCQQLEGIGEINPCLRNLAVASNDALICHELRDLTTLTRFYPYTRECLLTIINQTANYSLCNQLPGTGYSSRCFVRMAERVPDKNICALAEEDYARDYCYALVNDDVSLCFKINNDYVRLLCITPFVVKDKNASLCQQVSGNGILAPHRRLCCQEVRLASGDIAVPACREYLNDTTYLTFEWR